MSPVYTRMSFPRRQDRHYENNVKMSFPRRRESIPQSRVEPMLHPFLLIVKPYNPSVNVATDASSVVDVETGVPPVWNGFPFSRE